MNRLLVVNLVMSAIIGTSSYVATQSAEAERADRQAVVIEKKKEEKKIERVVKQYVGKRHVKEVKSFRQQIQQLRAQLDQEREILAKLFEDTSSTDQEVLEQLKKTCRLQNRIQVKITQHLLSIRQNLTPEQRKRFFQVVAKGLRHHGGPKGSHGKDRQRGFRPPPHSRPGEMDRDARRRMWETMPPEQREQWKQRNKRRRDQFNKAQFVSPEEKKD